MTKRFVILMSIIVVLAGGIALAADQPVPPVTGTEVAQQEGTSTDAPASEATAELEAQPRKPPLVLGLAVGSYTPIDSDVKDTFGGTKLRVGLRPLLTEAPERVRFMYDVSFYSLEKDDDQAILIPLTIGVIQGFGQGTKLQSYAGVNAGIFYGRVDAPSIGTWDSGWRWTANATVGLIYNKRLSLEARYEVMPRFAGFKFDSFSLMVGYKILQMRF